MTRERLDQWKALGEKAGPILTSEARFAIPELVAEIERTWGRITELQEANNREVERRREAERRAGI